MATQLGSTPDVLLLAVQQQVMLKMGLGAECVPLIKADKEEKGKLIAQAETVVFIALGDGVFDAGQTQNAGRACMVERLNLSTRIWTRVALDEATRSDIALADPSLGHLVLRHHLIDALADFFITDASANSLVSEPIKPLRTTAPRDAGDHKGWTRSTVEWVLPYELLLTVNAYP